MSGIGILGVTGRMGRAIANVAAAQDVVIAGGIDRNGEVHGDHPDASALAKAADVLIDFTSPDALAEHLDAAVAAVDRAARLDRRAVRVRAASRFGVDRMTDEYLRAYARIA